MARVRRVSELHSLPPVPVSVSDCPDPAYAQQPQVDENYKFRHTPPISILGCNRWPGAYEANILVNPPTLHDLLPWVRNYLSTKEGLTCKTLSRDFALSIYCSSLSYTRPWQRHRRHKLGFGAVNTAQSSVNRLPHPSSCLALFDTNMQSSSHYH
jgi:hypothetical protein